MLKTYYLRDSGEIGMLTKQEISRTVKAFSLKEKKKEKKIASSLSYRWYIWQWRIERLRYEGSCK